jgi:translation initiation factor eIF-2B subunit epsilon
MDIFKEDFVLVTGDIITNIDLAPIIKKHKEERLKNPEIMLTMVLKEQNPKKFNPEYVSIGYDKDSKKLLYYENDNNKYLNFDVTNFDKYNVQFRTDIYDTKIDICSPDILELYKSNFDWKDIRNNLFKEYILADDETNVQGNSINCYFTNDYAFRANSLRSYEIISKEIIKRYVL